VSTLHPFLTGLSTMGFLVATAYFARFWRQTKDRLFAIFAIAFAFMAVNRAVLIVYPLGRENQPYVYIARLIAFVLIAYAVIDKNRHK
jgi:hypothetical protein